MNEVFIGEYIRYWRRKANLTQEKLCEGICSPLSLSRLERGTQTPTSTTLNALLERLGLPGERCYALVSMQEQKQNSLRKEIVSLNVQYGSALETDKPKYLRFAYNRLHEFENIIDDDDHLSQQFILRSKVLLGKEDGTAYSLDEQLNLLMEAISLTVPHFNLDEIGNFLYCLDEVKVINQIAGVYSEMRQDNKAAEILCQLMKYVEKHYSNIWQSGGHFPLISHNYARCLLRCKRYEEALDIAEKGRSACVKYGHYQNLPGLLHCMAIAWHFNENDKSSEELFRQAYYLYQATDNSAGILALQNDAKKLLNIAAIR